MTTEGVKRIEDYFRKYWGRVDEARSFIPPERMPDFLRPINKLVIYDCKNGYVTIIYPGGGQITSQTFSTSRNVEEVINGFLERRRFTDAKGNNPPKSFRFLLNISGKLSLHLAEPQVLQGDPRNPARVYRTEWTFAHILLRLEPSDGLTDNPAKAAERDIRTFVFAEILKVETTPNIEETREKVIQKLRQLRDEYNNLLSNATGEEELQEFLKNNTFILAPFASVEDVYPKYALGKEYKTDFVIHNRPALPFTYTFVEIEPNSEDIFLKTKGRETEFTQRANHAIDQLMNWRIWVRDNIAYIRQDFPELDQCDYLLIMGRSNNLTDTQERKLAELNAEHNWRLLLTYDNISEKIRQLILNLESIAK